MAPVWRSALQADGAGSHPPPSRRSPRPRRIGRRWIRPAASIALSSAVGATPHPKPLTQCPCRCSRPRTVACRRPRLAQCARPNGDDAPFSSRGTPVRILACEAPASDGVPGSTDTPAGSSARSSATTSRRTGSLPSDMRRRYPSLPEAAEVLGRCRRGGREQPLRSRCAQSRTRTRVRAVPRHLFLLPR